MLITSLRGWFFHWGKLPEFDTLWDFLSFPEGIYIDGDSCQRAIRVDVKVCDPRRTMKIKVLLIRTRVSNNDVFEQVRVRHVDSDALAG